MEKEKKNAFGKAFSRTFSRKSAAPASTPAPAPPAAAPIPASTVAASAPPPQEVPAAASHPAAQSSSVAPITIPAHNATTTSAPDSANHPHLTSPTQVHYESSPTRMHHETSPLSPTNNNSQSMHLREGTGLSNSSTMSRQGLAGEDAEGLNPAEILFNRLAAFKGVVKNLQQYFDEVAQVEQGSSKAMNKTSGVLVVPFKDGQQFLGKGGLQDVYVGLRDAAKTRSEQHASTARFVEETIVKNLRRLKQDIKAKIKALKSDATLHSNKVVKEREATQEKISALAKAIAVFDLSGLYQPDMEKMGSDPYVINLALKRQLVKQVNEENLFARALKQCQDEIKTFEAYIIKEVKQILTAFSDYQLQSATTTFTQAWAPTQMALNVIQEDSEWNNFLERNGHRLFPSDLVDANPEELDYPCKDSPYVVPVKTAHLSRQSSVLKSWKEGYVVLTLAGWLHIFGSSDLEKDPVPDHSIYIPTATLGPHTEPGQKQHVFSLDGKGKGGLLHRDNQTFTLRAHSREEMLEWWTEISKRAAASTFREPGDGSVSRSGSVLHSPSAVHPASPEQSHAQIDTVAAAASPTIQHANLAASPTFAPASATTAPHVEPAVTAPHVEPVGTTEAAPIATTATDVPAVAPEATPVATLEATPVAAPIVATPAPEPTHVVSVGHAAAPAVVP